MPPIFKSLDDEKNRVFDILAKNASKNFVTRILVPDMWPKINLGGGHSATHRMAWGEADGKFLVFPEIVWDGKDLVNLGDKAFDYAMKNKEFIEFDNAEDADWVSRRYKLMWGIQ